MGSTIPRLLAALMLLMLADLAAVDAQRPQRPEVRERAEAREAIRQRAEAREGMRQPAAATGQPGPAASPWVMAPPAPEFVPPPAGELQRLTRAIDSGGLDREALRKARVDRGYVYVATGRHGLAVRELGALIREDRNDAVAHFALGMAHLGQRPGDAVGSFTQVIRLRGDLHDGYRARAWAHLSAGNYRNAVQDFDRVLRMHPEDTDALRGRAWAQLHDRRFDPAIRDFTDLHARTSHPDALLGRGLAHHYRGRNRDAREDFRSAMRYRPRAIPTYAYQDLVLDDWRRNRRVAEVLNRETRGRSASVDTWLAWGTLSHRAFDRPEGARSGYSYSGPGLNAFDYAVAAAPGDTDVLLFRALSKTQYGHRSYLDQAIADLTTIIERDPAHVEAHIRRALIRGADGNALPAAIADAERAFELSGNDPEVGRVVSFLHDRRARWEAGQVRAAEAQAQRDANRERAAAIFLGLLAGWMLAAGHADVDHQAVADHHRRVTQDIINDAIMDMR
jgi:tetratricopeptide (TPR) repeat protein